MPRYRVYLSRMDTYSIVVTAQSAIDALEVGREALCNVNDPDEFLEDRGSFTADDSEEIK